jgi:NitT/TauT family transport system substrate-binding protein
MATVQNGNVKLVSELILFVLFSTHGYAETIRTAIPSASIHYLSLYVAEEKGFFKDENLENEVVTIGGPAGIAALVNGSIDFSGAAGSGMRAAMSGAAIKVIMFQTEKVTWYLVGGPNIAKITDLKNKRVGVFALSDTSDALVTRYFASQGLAATDFTRIALGTAPGTIIAALKSGAVDAATLDPASIVRAEREGMRILAFLGDKFPYPFQGFAVTERKIADNPGQVRRWLRAMVRSLIFIRDNVDGATDVAMKRLKYTGFGYDLVAEGIRRYVKALPDGIPGLPSPEALKTVIEYDVKLPMKLKDDIPIERLMNLRFVEEVRKEFQAKRAQ